MRLNKIFSQKQSVVKQRIPQEHDAYLMFKPFMGIYVDVRKTENSEIRIPINIQPTQTYTTTYVSTVHSRHKNAYFQLVVCLGKFPNFIRIFNNYMKELSVKQFFTSKTFTLFLLKNNRQKNYLAPKNDEF